MKLNLKAFSLTVGLFAGAAWLVALVVSIFNTDIRTLVMLIGGLHPWFSYSLLGGLWIVVLHFICGFIIGWLFAWVYNKLS